jgi:hypothetical protein
MFVASLIALGLAPASATPAALVVPAHQWIVDYSRTACTLARRLGDEGSPIVAFNAPYGSEPGELVVLETGSTLQAGLNGAVQIRLDDGPPIAVHVRFDQRNGRTVSLLTPMPNDFLDRIAGASQLTVSKNNRTLFALALPNPRAAIAELARCNDDLLQSWGIDVAARRALSRKPRMQNFEWMFAIMPAASTYAILTADISERGRPLACRILISTGNQRMDRAVCSLLRSQARFEPALDSAGRPVPAQYVSKLRWLIDRDD